MSRSFEIVSESAASVEAIHAAFAREDYWLDRLAGDAASTLDSFTVDTEGAVEVHITQHLGRQILPPLVSNFVPGDLKLLYREKWHLAGEGRVRGESHVTASGGLGSSRADNVLTPSGGTSQLRSAGKVIVKIPLVGGKLEKSIGESLTKSIPATLRYTTTWIAEHS
ncbi:hypothetical protein FHT40_006643 [Mycolicibacterium sp. BK556]|uniref:DUF2505 domain-containing protein n=1 Tax=Mycobacteriaceae TaxID=1762 RepID=UPI00105D1F23|nr:MULTISPECIES: DUF2505 domain-containing protein [Mycobacteriaceae]MBB3606947.1 hypothetical protein [Mycolicibacterium sp. BK556]MBB3636704.1 hypothetical protein [Mycolicibacterium sp. BK607]MBB3752993.1 hypothetical protein [Mycolicibacterium sp. BK634]TDO09239.1 uncharacterized protein DUF2505 [Mycobacterium sp. BK086]